MWSIGLNWIKKMLLSYGLEICESKIGFLNFRVFLAQVKAKTFV